VEGALGYAYNQGPNAPNAISVNGIRYPAGISTSTYWQVLIYRGSILLCRKDIRYYRCVDSNRPMQVAHYQAVVEERSELAFSILL